MQLFILVYVMGISLVQASEHNGGFDPSLTRFVDYSASSVLDAYNMCGHNDGGAVGTFDPAMFDAGKVMATIKAIDKDPNRDCKYRIYSKSSNDAVAKFKHFTSKASKDPFSESAIECLKKEVSAYHHEEFREILEDKTNLGVFANLYDYNDNSDDNYSEGCAYYEFYIYRASGTVLKIVFNYTD